MSYAAPATVAVAALAVLLPTAAATQTVGGPATPLAPGLSGNSFFVAPSVEAALGPMALGGGFRLEWGEVESRMVRGRVALGLARIGLVGRLQLSSASSSVQTDEDLAVSLAASGPRLGVLAGYRAADVAAGAFASTVHSFDARTWLDVGPVLLGVTARTSEAIDHARGVLETYYHVGGYDFLSRTEFSYLRTTRYQDLELDLRGQLGPVHIMGVVGRGFTREDSPDRTWGYVRLRTSLVGRLDLVAEAGRDAGLPAILRQPSSFARLGVTFPLLVARPARPVPPPTQRQRARVQVTVDAAGGLELVLTAPDAQTVEVRGDFTDWRIRPMRPLGPDRWSVPIRTGVLRFNVRINGGDWIVPAGVAAVPDEFSDAPVAVIVVDDG